MQGTLEGLSVSLSLSITGHVWILTCFQCAFLEEGFSSPEVKHSRERTFHR